MNRLVLLNPEHVPPHEVETWPTRYAIRAVALDQANQVPLLHVRKHGYYKLPGGGVETGEDISTALRRECAEEIGCDIAIKQELGWIEEYKSKFNLHQISYCYLVHITSKRGLPTYTDEEKENDFSIVWQPLKVARSLLESCTTDDHEGKLHITPRDLRFIDEAIKIIELNN
jgi:8-oxo-dGTP diphosphatase